MDVTENTRECEEELIENKTEVCKLKDLDFPEEDDFGSIETRDHINILWDQGDNSSTDCYDEEEELADKVVLNNPDENGASQQEVRKLKSKKRVDYLKNVTFEDKDMSKEDMFVCNLCHRVFINGYKLKSHLFKVHGVKKTGRPRKLERLNKRNEFPKENWIPDVQKLAKRVNDTKVFVCDQCPYTVTRCDSMTKHVLRVHSKGLIKPQYMCEICGKTFIDKAYLRNHGLSHIEEPQFFCEVCGRRFHRQPSLRRHIQSHSEEKQFSCSLCDYQTNRKHLMYKHAENHRTGKAYSCKVCSAKFYTQISLRKHSYIQHATRCRYACSFCKIGFSSRERMWCHMQKIHFACEVKDFKTEDFKKQEEVKVEYIEVKMEPKALLT